MHRVLPQCKDHTKLQSIPQIGARSTYFKQGRLRHLLLGLCATPKIDPAVPAQDQGSRGPQVLFSKYAVSDT